MTMQVAFYKGPASDLLHQISHLGIQWWTDSPYSHCEIVWNGICYSASSRDGGVRSKKIDLTTGKWDVLTIPVSAEKEKQFELFYLDTDHCKYDWAGVGRYVFPSLPNPDNRWYCSEWCAASLGFEDIEMPPGLFYYKVKEVFNV